MPIRLRRLILVVSAVLALAGAAHANSIDIFNTGVDAFGTPLSNGIIGDPHYLLAIVPGGTTAIRVFTSAGGFPVGPWVGDDSLSAWIGPNNTSQQAGNYDYQTTFDLTGLDPATAVLTGRWATDNAGLDIRVNGQSTGIGNSVQYVGWTPFTIGSRFVAGVNTLDFIVQNNEGPTGLRVELSGTADPIPEPVSFVLLGAGLGALGILRRRVV